MTPAQTQAIQQDAERAAQEGRTPNERCPHPFSSEQGLLWVECYWAANVRHVMDTKPAIDKKSAIDRRGN